MQVYLTALGCRLNEAELQMWARDFHKNGISVTPKLDLADLIVINTCAVTKEAARKSRQAIRKLHRKNPSAKLVVTGCYASLEKQQAEALLGVDLIVSNADKSNLPDLCKEVAEWKSMPFAAIEADESALFARNKERAFIKIQDGCRYRCTYCIVTVARGEEASRPINELIEEIVVLDRSGVKEIVLAGVHVGGYGSDIGVSLYQLVEAILQQTRISRIRFASVEPWDLPDNFFELFTNPRLMPHMHLPIQSGSDQILRKMSRRIKAETFEHLVRQARKVVPGFNITTDIIVGFPGETESDFELSKAIIGEVGFGHVHIFSYSNREGTKAASFPDQISPEVKKRRSQALHYIAQQTKKDVAQKMLGKKVEILWEGRPQKTPAGQFRIYGYTENYHKVYLELEKAIDISNKVIACEVIAFDEAAGCLVTRALSPIKPEQQRLIIKQI